jgi:hypothetical protein
LTANIVHCFASSDAAKPDGNVDNVRSMTILRTFGCAARFEGRGSRGKRRN